jgi:hypothetical protein
MVAVLEQNGVEILVGLLIEPIITRLSGHHKCGRYESLFSIIVTALV